MNATQVKNILTPLVGILAAWLARKLPFVDAATWGTLIDSVATAVVLGVLGFFNKTTNLMDTVGKEPGTTVVTTAANAAALLANPDVIAATPQIANAVSAAK